MAGHTGTIVKARYSRGLKAALLLAKGHVRYAVHRCNEQGQRQYREVWDRDGGIGKAARVRAHRSRAAKTTTSTA